MNKEFLYTLLDSMSVSGHEIPLQKKVIEEMKPFCDEIRTDYTGNVISIQKILRRGCKNTQKNCTEKISMTQIIMMV